MSTIELQEELIKEVSLLSGNEKALKKALKSLRSIASSIVMNDEEKELLNAFKQIKSIKEGKVKTKPVEELLNGL